MPLLSFWQVKTMSQASTLPTFPTFQNLEFPVGHNWPQELPRENCQSVTVSPSGIPWRCPWSLAWRLTCLWSKNGDQAYGNSSKAEDFFPGQWWSVEKNVLSISFNRGWQSWQLVFPKYLHNWISIASTLPLANLDWHVGGILVSSEEIILLSSKSCVIGLVIAPAIFLYSKRKNTDDRL